MLLTAESTPAERQSAQVMFYAGADALLRLIINVGKETLSEERVADVLEATSRELIAFASELAIESGTPPELVALILAKNPEGKLS